MQMAKSLNGRLASWVAVVLLALGIFAGVILYAADGHSKADAAGIKADTAIQGVQEERQARLAAERETRAWRQGVNTELGKILGILEREGDDK